MNHQTTAAQEWEHTKNDIIEEIERLKKEIDWLTERRRQTHRRLAIEQRLLSLLSQDPKEVSFQRSWRVFWKHFIVWVIENDETLKELLEKPGARARFNQLLGREPAVSWGEVYDELERV